MTKKQKAWAITDYIKGQKFYILPIDVYKPVKQVEIYNKKKKEWRKVPFEICFHLIGRKLKTDTHIKICYNQNVSNRPN